MEPTELKSDGRKLILSDEGISIYPNRLDCLQMADAIYKEYSKSGTIEKDTFPEWLREQIIKEENGKEDKHK